MSMEPGTMAQTHRQKLLAGQEAARRRREEQARTILGDNATAEQVDAFVKQARREQAMATRLANESKKMGKQAQATLKQAQRPTPPTAVPIDERPQHYPPPGPVAPQVSEALTGHPIFGSAIDPARVSTVDIERLPSQRPEHNAPGVTPGWLEEVGFEAFSKPNVRARHGGGRYKFIAKDGAGRVVAVKDEEIGGRARPLEEPVEEPAFLRARGGYHPGAPDPRDEVPPWAQALLDEQARRLERLEQIAAAPTRYEPSPEEKLEAWKKEQAAKEEVDRARRREEREDEERKATAKEAAEDKKHERRMAEIKAETEARVAAERERSKEMLALVTQSKPADNQMTMIAPLITGMATLMESSHKSQTSLFSIIRDVAGGDREGKKDWKDRLMDMAEDNLKSAWDAGIFTEALKNIGKPKAGAQPAATSGLAFRLPDGRVVPAADCAAFVARYKAKHGVEPSNEVCAEALTAAMNAAEAQQRAHAQQHQQQVPAQIPGPTLEEVEEWCRQAGQNAAGQATSQGATPEQAGAAAAAASQAMGAEINARIRAAQGLAAQPAAPQQQPAPQPAPPPPAAAAVASVQQASAPTPAPAIAATAAQAAAPATPSDMVSTPFMARSFMEDAADAFQAGQDPFDFLGRSIKLRKISKEARGVIADIYSEDDEASVQAILVKVKTALEERGVPVPLTLMPIFMGSERGAPWIESLLFACQYDDMEKARKESEEE